MRRRRTTTSQPRQPEQPAQETAVLLAEAQRLLDYHWRRGDAFERKAVGLLGFTGVVVALLMPNIPTVLALRGHHRTTALLLGAGALTFLALSALSALGVLWTRNTVGVNVTRVRELWTEHLSRARDNTYVASDAWHALKIKQELVNMLLHSGDEHATDPSPVQSMNRDADRRAAWFTWCASFNAAALLLILAVTITTILEKL